MTGGYVVPKSQFATIVQEVKLTSPDSPWAWGYQTSEYVLKQLAALKEKKRGLVDLSEVNRLLSSLKTAKMIGGANLALNRILIMIHRLKESA